jgi:hypothetical protein
VLLVVLKELRAAGLPLSNPSTMVLRDVPVEAVEKPIDKPIDRPTDRPVDKPE